MATRTTYLNLIKPDYSDAADIADINANMDTLDDKIKGIDSAAATLVSNLAIGSDVTWNGKKFTNKRLGVSGLIDTNGYIALGPNFGRLIIQWGHAVLYNKDAIEIALPIQINRGLCSLANDSGGGAYSLGISATSIAVIVKQSGSSQIGFNWFVLGR